MYTLKPIVDMTEVKITLDNVSERFNQRVVVDLFKVAQVHGKDMPNLTNIAFERFLSEKTNTYTTIDTLE
jgi:hypothetical protein